MKIGIDFGTCYSSVGVMIGGTIPQTNLLKDNNGSGIPTLLMHSQETGGDYYGYDCELKPEAIDHPEEVIRYIKRRIREAGSLDAAISSNGADYTAGEVVKKYLTYLLSDFKKIAEKSDEISNKEFENVCITTPVGISSSQMAASTYNAFLKKTVAEICNIPTDAVSILEEPVAAAVSYLKSDDDLTKQDQTVLVFDLGGGTLDITIVEYKNATDTYIIKEKQGDLELGGGDWDRALANYFRDKTNFHDSLTVKEEYEFLRLVKKAKEDLCTQKVTAIIFGDAMDKITIDEFNEATRPLLDRAIELTRVAVRNYESTGGTIDKIILVGGSCNMRQVEPAMEAAFPHLSIDDVLVHDPSKAIAKGATIYASMLVPDPNKTTETEKTGGVEHIATHTYGFGTHYHGEPEESIYNMIFKDMKIGDTEPLEVEADTYFCPLHDNQKVMGFTIYESDYKPEECKEGHWIPLSAGNANGISFTTPIPAAYLGHATDYSAKPVLILTKDQIMYFELKDEDGNVAWSSKNDIEL